jgi:hypothetical protein
MRIKFAWLPLLAFVTLQFFLGEAHELVHTGLGRLLCGCWGPRDFNVWSLCSTCDHAPLRHLAATYAGPLFTFALMWWGYYLLAPNHSVPQRSVGFALVFANLPFARLLGAVFMGGNDEVYALRPFFSYPIAWAIGATFVIVAVAPPLVRAYTALHPRGRLGVFLAFFFLPMALTVAVVLGVLNTLLASGFLATNGVLGSPVLVTCWTVSVCVALGLTYRHLSALGQSPAVVGDERRRWL